MERQLLIKAIAKADNTSTFCDACDDYDDAEHKAKAVAYCVECRENLCSICAEAHRRVKMSRFHTQVEYGDSESLAEEQLVSNAASTTCDKHPNQTLDVFCHECRAAICVVCYVSTHKQHNCSDIKEKIEIFRQQVNADTESIDSGIVALGEISSSLEKQKTEFVGQVADTEDEVIKRAEGLQELIENHKLRLLSELAAKKHKAVTYLEELNDDVKRRRSGLEIVKLYTEELSKRGTAGDIARDMFMLQDRTKELTMLETLKRAQINIGGLAIKFTESSLLSDETKNTVGKINFIGE